MFSLVRRTALMPCISVSSSSVAFLPMVSLMLRACDSIAEVSALARSPTAPSIAMVERRIDSSNSRSLSENGIVQRRGALDQLHVERLGTIGQRGVERACILFEHRLQCVGARTDRPSIDCMYTREHFSI